MSDASSLESTSQLKVSDIPELLELARVNHRDFISKNRDDTYQPGYQEF